MCFKLSFVLQNEILYQRYAEVVAIPIVLCTFGGGCKTGGGAESLTTKIPQRVSVECPNDNATTLKKEEWVFVQV